MEPKAESRWSLSIRSNRAALAIVVGLLTWVAFRRDGLPLLVGVVFYVLLTAIVSSRRDSN